MKKTHGSARGLWLSAVCILTAIVLMGATTAQAASSTLGASLTRANLTAVNDQAAATSTIEDNLGVGTDDQTAATTTNQANVPSIPVQLSVKASSTMPLDNDYITIGSCKVTFSAASSTSENCSSGNATIQISDLSSSSTEASLLGKLTGLTDPNHGALTSAYTTNNATSTFTTTGPEISTVAITYSDNTTNHVLSGVQTQNGIVPVKQQETITIGGTPEQNDVFTLNVGPTSLSYYVQPTDTTLQNIANGWISHMNTAGFPFTASTGTNSVILTANTAGTGFKATTTTTNRSAQKQVEGIKIDGTVEAGDVFNFYAGASTTSYTATSTDSTLQDIANGLYAAINGLAGLPFTVSTSTNAVVLLTAKVAGTGFTAATTSVINRTPIAEIVTFTPGNVTYNETLNLSINSNNYSYKIQSGNSVSDVANGLVSALANDPAVSCVVNSGTVVCTAKSVGTAFTYSTSVSNAPVVSSGGGGGGGGGAPAAPVTPAPVVVPVVVSPSAPVITHPAVFTKIIRQGDSNKTVKTLQQALNALDFTVSKKGSGSLGHETTYFGVATKKALVLFQKAHHIVPANGVLTLPTRTALNNLMK